MTKTLLERSTPRRRANHATPRGRFDSAVRLLHSISAEQFSAMADQGCDDERLIHLHRWTSEIGNQAVKLVRTKDQDIEAGLRFNLANVGYFTLIWITLQSLTEKAAIEAIWQERERQRRLFREGKISFACESSIVDVRRKFRALAEEVGEVAHALDQVEQSPASELAAALNAFKTELIQVAAVAVAWLESLEIA